MKKPLLLLMMMIVGISVFADGFIMDINEYENDDYNTYIQEAAVILEGLDSRKIGEFTVDELKALSMDLSIPFQKIQYVRKSKIASAVFPGVGQYMNDDAIGGTLFMLSNIAVISGTLITAYFMLPDEVNFDNLDYENDSKAVIQTAWDNQSFNDLLPAMGVMAAGIVVNGVIRMISADHAGKLAQKNIAESKIKFEPKIMIPIFNSSYGDCSNQGGFGLGMGMRF